MLARTQHVGFEWDAATGKDYVHCPQCGTRFEIVAAGYWYRKTAGENVVPRTKVFCSNKCKQKAYRGRRAPQRNTTPNVELTGAARHGQQTKPQEAEK